MTGDQVVVRTRSGDQAGTIVERWHGPVTGDSYVVNVPAGFIIAPVAHVRRVRESDSLSMPLEHTE